MAQQLAKLFDSMSSLQFTLDENDKPTKEAKGMYSRDGEFVSFDKPCQCVGQVRMPSCIYLCVSKVHIRESM